MINGRNLIPWLGENKPNLYCQSLQLSISLLTKYPYCNELSAYIRCYHFHLSPNISSQSIKSTLRSKNLVVDIAKLVKTFTFENSV